MATAMVERAAVKADNGENLRLELRKVIKAKRARVFEAWTKPEVIRHWFGPRNMVVTEVSSDLRVGGAYRIEMRGALEASMAERPNESMEHRAGATGVYTEIVPDERIAFTWRGDWRPEEETLVTVTLRDVEGGTEVTLVHEGFVTAESRQGHEHGWTGSLEKLSGVLEAV